MPKKKPRNLGLHTHRFEDNPEEKRFADAWSNPLESYVLPHLLSVEQNPVTPSERDEVVAATVIQWLGSPVGQYFLEQLGYTKKLPK